MAAFLLTGQTRSDPAWPFFFAGRRLNDRPDRVWPTLAIQKNAPYIRQIIYIFCAAFVDFASVDVTVVSVFSSLKRFKKSFFFVFYIL